MESKTKTGTGVKGITPNGIVFDVPLTTPPVGLSKFLKPATWSLKDVLKYSPIFNFLIFAFYPESASQIFLVLFLFWRIMYDGVIGYFLHLQSKHQTLTRFFTQATDPEATFYGIIKRTVSLGMGEDYDFKKVPPHYNAWLGWRIVIDVVLNNDFVCYFAFCLSQFQVPQELDAWIILCYTGGIILSLFALWSKLDAYRVVEDYAWYWGDFFFLIDKKLTFDRVFSLSPHPMYTIGYSFYYGAALITRSYPVLYVSLVGHILQLIFLATVETPHIEKTYPDFVRWDPAEKEKAVLLYDRHTGYFRKDLIIFHNFNPIRSGEISLMILIFYIIITGLVFPSFPLTFYIFQAMFWRCFHSLGLGYILYRQSADNAYMSTFFAKGFTKNEAFANWKTIYNLSLTMTWITFLCAAWRLSDPIPTLSEFASFNAFLSSEWLLRQIGGIVLILINIWSSVSTFEVLGEFGWFYGDFFIDEIKAQTLYYTGVYRFLNNPEVVTGCVGYYGMALMSGSPVCWGLAVISHLMVWFIIERVERPHMERLYGEQVREVSGVIETVKEIVTPQIKELEGKVKEFEEKVKEMKSEWKGTLEKTLSPNVKRRQR